MRMTTGLPALFLTLAALAAAIGPAPAARAQVLEWIQIEARPSLRQAHERARAHAARLTDVNGFAIARGWYAIALGPYPRGDALRLLGRLKAEKRIPADSFVTDGAHFRQQFWPIGVRERPARPSSSPPDAAPAPSANPAGAPAALFPEPDETPREARRGEARLDRAERMELQEALQWEGFYAGAIDGAFGRGTRAAMRAWQGARGYPVTGVLTTRQRAELLAAWRADLQTIGLKQVRDIGTGIEIMLPLKLVEFNRYDPPLAHYDSRDDSGVRVFLISQKGDAGTLAGLYDVLQSLAIIPPEGERRLHAKGFEITGRNKRLITHAEARLEEDRIKGFILVWPAGQPDTRRHALVLDAMRESFAPFGSATLDDLALNAGSDQHVDLIAGLEIRKPRLSRSGFFIDAAGTVLTTAEAVAQCGRITIDREHRAEIAALDDRRGLALLRPATPLAPDRSATLRKTTPRLNAEISIAGYSYEGLLDAPTLTFGKLADIRGLQGEDWLLRLSLDARPGDAGGPVLDSGGHVQAMLLPRPQEGGRRLPEDVWFAASADALRGFLEAHGGRPQTAPPGKALAPEDLATMAEGMTVLVSCWE